MPDRLMLEGIACPVCGSSLVSIDADAEDDAAGRYRLRSADWFVRFLGTISAVVIVSTAYMTYRYWRDGATVREWIGLGEGILGVPLALFWLAFVVRAWVWSRTSRAGRLAACHACGKRWRLWS